MNTLQFKALCGVAAGILCCANAASQQPRPASPASAANETRLERQSPLAGEGTSQTSLEAMLPNGRRITPRGAWWKTAPYPFALAIRPDGQQVVAPSVGWPFGLNVFDTACGRSETYRLRSKRQIPSGSKSVPATEALNGVTYSLDGRFLYVSTGDSGAVDVYETAGWTKVARHLLDGPVGKVKYRQSFSGASILSADGMLLYVLDEANWRVAAMDAASGRVVQSAPTGAEPFALTLSPDQRHLYVVNAGLFEYKPVPGVDRKALPSTGLHFPPTAFPSREARLGTFAEGHKIPALGDENDPRGSSLWTYDLAADGTPRVSARLRLGHRILEGRGRTVGGAAPMGVVASREAVYVSLSHQDSVAVLSPDGTHQLAELPLSPFAGHLPGVRDAGALRGVMPAGMKLCGGRLYVAEAGIDALAVVDPQQRRVLGHVPVGWYPSAVACAADGGAVLVANTKGRGAGPNGGADFHATGGSYIGEREFGSISVLPEAALLTGLEGDTAQVVSNNLAAIGGAAPLPHLRHVFLIIRENRTFDEIFGDLPGADGDPSLARWGMHGWRDKAPEDRTLAVTPNAHALATRFATSDRFFVDSDVSADGHRWMVGAAETPWFHLAWTSNYGGRRNGDPLSTAPGRRTLGGGSDAPMPEDEPQFGTLWEHVVAGGLSLRNYGEGIEVEGAEEIAGAEPEGQRLVLNAPVPAPVFQSTDRQYPTFNLGIPDQYRYDEFARDFGSLLAKRAVPSLIVIRLPNDHTAAPRPADGYPDTASYVADNDLALGRIVALVSHSAIWPDTAILVAEDDAQGGVDHVDAHRSVMLAISPWVKPGTVSHRHSSMGSLQKTIYELLGLGPLSLEDALAGDLRDIFVNNKPDLRPFDALPADARVFDPARARLARPKNAEEAEKLRDMDDPAEMQKAAHLREARRSRKKQN